MGEKHAQTRDEKARKSKPDKHGLWGKSTHILEMRRQEKSEQDKHRRWGKCMHKLETRR
jgi:hypothetical protein